MRYLFLRRILLCMRPHAPALLLYMCAPLLLGKACVILRRILLCIGPHATTTILLYVCSHMLVAY